MNHLLNCAVLVGEPLVLLLCGYGIVAFFKTLSPAERLATALLAGVGWLLWSVSVVNLFRPLAGGWAWLCLWPAAVTLLGARARAALGADLRATFGHRRGAAALALAAGFLIVMLWPLLAHPAIVFYDGTSNHDSFFWISAAEHLMRHDYLTVPPENPLRPLMSTVAAIIGLEPAWGRMGAEGLLALFASLSGSAPLNIYLAASAALYAPWIAAVFLTTRTFLAARLSPAGLVALLVLQPAFVFFFGNANLPNLIGALCAALAVIATERSLRAAPDRWGWLALLALSFHGLLCSYPEMVPFVLLPGGLLWLRACRRAAWRPALFTALGWIAGLALNPVSAIRAWIGFFVSFGAARADENWANLFNPLTALQHPLGLASLAVQASKTIPAVVAVLLILALVLGGVLALRRATDRLGAVFILAGAGALLAYTLGTQFAYGWQKTVQFGGALWVAVFPVAIVDALATGPSADRRRRWLTHAALAGLVLFYGYATWSNCRDGYKWSERKVLSQDWFKLRDHAAAHLRGAPVLVEAASFRMAFFHGMWAAYFLRDHDLYYAARGRENGGYLRGGIRRESDGPLPPLGAILVGRPWADSIDANSPRQFTGDNVVLLNQRNQVSDWTGFVPDNGPPENAETQATFEVRPHSPSEFVLVLAAHRPEVPTTLRLRRQVDGQPDVTLERSGPPPWRFVVPLTPGRLNRIELDSDPKPRPMQFPFTVREFRIQAARE